MLLVTYRSDNNIRVVYRVAMELVKLTFWGLQCLRCDHRWIPREVPQDANAKKPPVLEDEDLPRTCPGCRSPYWSKPRQKRTKKDR